MSYIPNVWQGLPDPGVETWNNYDARIAGTDDNIRSEGERHLQLAKPAGWTAQAACVGQWDLFDARGGTARAEEAKAICAQCPVRAMCLDQAVAQEWTIGRSDYVGIRGGLDSRERYRHIQSVKKAERRATEVEIVA